MFKIALIISIMLILSGCGRALQRDGGGASKNQNQSNTIPIKLDKEDIQDIYSIRLTSPQNGQVLKSPFLVGGEAQLPNDTAYIRVKKPNGDVLISEQTKIKTEQAGEKGPFSVLINFQFKSTDQGIVEVYGIDLDTGEYIALESVEVSFDLR